MSKIASVVILSSLPQLDREFDFLIPPELGQRVVFGSRVSVQIGKSQRKLEAIVVKVKENSDFKGPLSAISELIGENPVLSHDIYELCRQLAMRSTASLGEFLKQAIPAHMPKVEKSFSSLDFESVQGTGSETPEIQKANATTSIVAPGVKELSLPKGSIIVPNWVRLIVSQAIEVTANNSSIICLLPNYRHQRLLLAALDDAGLLDRVCEFGQNQTKGDRYISFLRAHKQQSSIIVGSRTAILSPVNNLSVIAVFDEADDSYVDESSPYISTREAALIRHSITGCAIHFSGYSRSTEIQRLVELGFLRDQTESFAKPRVSVSEPGFRIDSFAYRAIREGLSRGSVLIQVASPGGSVALFCIQCQHSAKCAECSGPIYVDSSGKNRCRWCNAFQLGLTCSCGSNVFQNGRAGSTRTATELGKAFPNTRVLESSGERKISEPIQSNTLVIATAGAEPYSSEGYAAVVLLDAQVLLNRQFLTSHEEAFRLWSNTAGFVKQDSEIVLVGVAGEVAKRFALWDQIGFAKRELQERMQLDLPPHVRMGSIVGPLDQLAEIKSMIEGSNLAKLFGPTKLAANGDYRLILKYTYSSTLDLAAFLKSVLVKVAAGVRINPATGRRSRALKVKLQDSQVV